MAARAPERTGSVGSGGVPEGSITQEGDGFLLNFATVEVAALAKSILGDLLGENYTVDSRATGTVSLNSARAVPRGRLVSVMETALKAVNIAVAREGAVYRITPSSEAIGSGRFDYAAAGEGYGTSVIPANGAGAGEPPAGRAEVDAATNLVLIQDGRAARRSTPPPWSTPTGCATSRSAFPRPIVARNRDRRPELHPGCRRGRRRQDRSSCSR
jgi:general secretion pathway protein D